MINDWMTTSARPLIDQDSSAKVTTPATVASPSSTPVVRMVRTSRRSAWTGCRAVDMDRMLRRVDWAKLVVRYQAVKGESREHGAGSRDQYPPPDSELP